MTLNTVNVLDGNSFVISDKLGDLTATPTENHGLFLDDTRYLSHFELTINGEKPKLLSVDDSTYFRVQFFGALATGTVYVDSHLSVVRRRTVSRGFKEHIRLSNHDSKPMELRVRVEVGADFADLFEVKDKLEKKGSCYRRVENGGLVLGYERGSFQRETHLSSSAPAECDEHGFSFQVNLAPKSSWVTEIEVRAARKTARGLFAPPTTTSEREDLERDLEAWLASAPRLHCSHEQLHLTYRRSLVDLAALRFATPVTKLPMPAAGLPWFMTIFGRDSLLTSFQALPFFPVLAQATLTTLAMFQGQADDAFRDEEPGKILHEIRLGEMTGFKERPHSPYFGSSDSTPLFLILLEEYTRWSGDRSLARMLENNVRAAVRWIDVYGDRDRDGFVEYQRRNTQTGLENQCWKDSWNSIAFRDGSLAKGAIATCEIQGYVYDAKCRTARLARDVYEDGAWADQLEREAAQLKERFNEAFWVKDRGFFALALDGQKRQVDSLTSNMGHLLWSGIAEPAKAALCVQHLMGKELFSGWGVRTLGKLEGAYNPIGYHVGTVWPHDTSFIAWGMRRYGYRHEAGVLARAMLEAAECFHHRLPEAFAGYERNLTNFPVEYPTACSPQAWASGAPLLMLRSLLGLESDGCHLIVDPALPEPFHRLELLDIPGAWGRLDAFGRVRRQVD
jgi:glycogen debranching enzyme